MEPVSRVSRAGSVREDRDDSDQQGPLAVIRYARQRRRGTDWRPPHGGPGAARIWARLVNGAHVTVSVRAPHVNWAARRWLARSGKKRRCAEFQLHGPVRFPLFFFFYSLFSL